MDNLTDFATAAAAAQNPQTAAADLAVIAQNHPTLRAAVAGHPNVYPALLDWLNQTGDPAVQAAVAARRANPAQTSAPSVPSPAPAVPSAAPSAPSPAPAVPSFVPAPMTPATPAPAAAPGWQQPYQPYLQAPQPAKSGRGKGILTAVLIVVALAIIAALVIFIIKPGGIFGGSKASPKAPWSATWKSADQSSFTASAITTDGGVVAIGCTTPSNSQCQSLSDDAEGVLGKYDQSGKLIWYHTYGDGNSVTNFTTLAIAPDGTIVVGGFTNATSGDFTAPNGGLDAFLAAFSPDGTTKWTKSFGGSGDEWFNAVAISNNTIFAAGVTDSSDGGFNAGFDNRDAFTASFQMNGDENWIKSYSGDGDDYFNAMAIAADGSIVVSGLTSSTTGDFPAAKGDQDALIASLKTDGSVAWAKTFGGSSSAAFYTVAVAPTGAIIAGGFSDSPDGDLPATNGGDDAVVMSVSPTGSPNWTKVVGGSDDDAVESLTVGSDGTVIAVGDAYSTDGDFSSSHGGQDAFVMSLSSTGTQNWLKVYGGTDDDWFRFVDVAANGNIVATGGTYSTDGDFPATNGNQDAVIASLKPDGSLN